MVHRVLWLLCKLRRRRRRNSRAELELGRPMCGRSKEYNFKEIWFSTIWNSINFTARAHPHRLCICGSIFCAMWATTSHHSLYPAAISANGNTVGFCRIIAISCTVNRNISVFIDTFATRFVGIEKKCVQSNLAQLQRSCWNRNSPVGSYNENTAIDQEQ